MLQLNITIRHNQHRSNFQKTSSCFYVHLKTLEIPFLKTAMIYTV